MVNSTPPRSSSILAHAFNRLRSFRALVIGDFMLDRYTSGRVKRISPEAPVQVLEVLKQESRPGGAGNAVLNLLALGGSVIAVGRVGKDAEGEELKATLIQAGADVRGLIAEKGYRTPIKNRLIADSQQLLRVDFETISPIDPAVEEAMIEQMNELIPSVEVIAISDYGKGVLSDRLTKEAIAIARKKNIPCLVDPKGMDFSKYRGATILKPNLGEAYAAANMPASADLGAVAKQILGLTDVTRLLITRSEAGMSLFDRSCRRSDFPVRSREVKDVTGAGDTVLAMLCLGVASGLELSLSVQLANIAAGISIERIGCVQISLSEIAERLLEIDCHSKIFDGVHAYPLQQVLKKKPYALVVLEESQSISRGLFRMIQQLSRNKARELVLFIQDANPSDEFVHLLSSIHDIKAILLQKESLKTLCDVIPPQEAFFIEGGQIKDAKGLLALLMSTGAVV